MARRRGKKRHRNAQSLENEYSCRFDVLPTIVFRNICRYLDRNSLSNFEIALYNAAPKIGHLHFCKKSQNIAKVNLRTGLEVAWYEFANRSSYCWLAGDTLKRYNCEDVLSYFPDHDSVNQALRSIIPIIKKHDIAVKQTA